MITSDRQNVVKFTHLISKGDNNKCYVISVFRKVFKNSIKLSTSSFFVMLQTFFTHTALKDKLSTPRVLRHSRHLATHALVTRRTLGHSGTQGTFLGNFVNS